MSALNSHKVEISAPGDGWPDVIQGWQCIGCGRIEAQRPCVGICQDRAAHFVDADDYWRLAEQFAATASSLQHLQEFLRRFSRTTPRDGAWKNSYRALQAEAVRLLAPAQDGEDQAKVKV